MSSQASSVILVPTDFTASARACAEVAVALAGKLGARVCVVHVRDAGPRVWARDEEDAARDVALAAAALDGEVRRLDAIATRPVESRLLVGRPAEEIVQLADDAKALMIVVAASSAVSSIFQVGGTAERVVQGSRVPVLVVRSPAMLQGWLVGERLNVTAMLDEDAASDRAIEWLRILPAAGACEIQVVHGYYSDLAARRYGLEATSIVDPDPEAEAYLTRDLVRRIGTVDAAAHVSVRAVHAIGRMGDALLASPEARRSALIVVGNHRPRGLARLSSVATVVLQRAACSVLVVPSDAPSVASAPLPRVRRVVAATDFSPFAAAAIRHAYGLVAATGGEVVLAHVETSASAALDRGDPLEALRALVMTAPPRGVITSVVSVQNDDPAVGLVEIAERAAADCIVVASHGETGLRKLVLGSVAAAVVQRSHRPVLVVRPPVDA
jgi:nucleotide-binding universal stress UspA family protein